MPERYQWVYDINPLATLIESYRAVLIGTPSPGAPEIVGAGVFALVLAAVGLWLFRRLEPGFVDEL